ncbi:family 1 encapsulin nanocompartment shell protein [Agrobacterium sp. rho-13.3]|uniref:family 1 encapsulin nanocompartment shell protein n=1 Tax=Agrobacterium sp. rho-13.3 TaxID=3072980 RepID=UPI002A162C31|nr:family 1 encapsulin nanocompartment shell protein [Agrobacterium sp. rho-13.3]MDX8311938.1 family 1 encapsulin nanocompartment shell protein [Agrobacterium sp. rho-13.3]
MNNLHRELAPISAAAWTQIEEEASRTLKRYLAARKLVDLIGPKGFDLSAVGTGHTNDVPPLREGLKVVRREIAPVIELRVPFMLTRRAIDDVERGANDSYWQPLKDAAKTMAFAEDHVVFEGYEAAGIRQVTSNELLTLPGDIQTHPEIVERAVNALRLAGVNGPYALLLGADPYTALTGGSDDGYPILKHIQKLIDKEVVWSPAVAGGVVVSIGYLSHDADGVELYLQETLPYRVQTSGASVVLDPPPAKPAAT